MADRLTVRDRYLKHVRAPNVTDGGGVLLQPQGAQ